VTAFDLLHPGLQHHIVNSLGWRELRPFQEEVIPAVLRGEHVLVIAPTAGGKTEAAILPILSRMLTEDWRGLSVLYLCPIRALLNNLHVRLSRYATLVGRSCSLWHGDVTATERNRINKAPPDILLTTPESLEVMLISAKSPTSKLFKHISYVVVDEVHSLGYPDMFTDMFDAGVVKNVANNADINLITTDRKAIRMKERTGYIVLIPEAVVRLKTTAS